MAAKLDRLKWIICKVHDPKRRCLEEGGQYNIFVFVGNFLWYSKPRGKKITKFFKVDKKKSCN